MIKNEWIFDRNKMQEKIQQAKLKGTTIDLLNNLIDEKEKYSKTFVSLMNYTNKIHKDSDQSVKKNILSKIISGLNLEDITEPMVKSGAAIEKAESFRTALTMYSRKRQLSNYRPERLIFDNVNGYRFADKLNVKTPKTMKENLKLNDIPQAENIVIKPSRGSGGKGVYLVFSGNEIYKVRTGTMLAGWTSLFESMQNDIISNSVKEDSWNIEELLLNKHGKPAHDLKFFSFYGKVALVQEVKRYPELKYCWRNTNGDVRDVGIYNDQLFNGDGFNQLDIKLIEQISLEIPLPFMRIDFLMTNNGMVMGEFTHRPGYYHKFNKEYDQLLGRLFLEAEGRLMSDLLNGKKFEIFKSL